MPKPLLALILSLLLGSAALLPARAQSVSASVLASSGGSKAQFLKVETSTLVFNVLYRYGQVTAAGNGAYGPNIRASPRAWFLEYQRGGGTDVIAGSSRNDTGLIAEGLRMFQFGLAREARNGSFPGSAWPFHGTAMFLAEAAPALIVLKSFPMGKRFASEIRWQTGRLRSAAYYMVRSVGGAGRIDDQTKNQRRFEAALGLGGTGVLSGDGRLTSWSTTYAWQGIHMERRNGVMPEDGGHDSGYQALGLSYATRYLVLVPKAGLYQALYHAVAKGESWELSRVRGNGTVNSSGNTRTGGCRERDPLGRCKAITAFYAPVFAALARWAVISHDPRFQAAAYKVWSQNCRLQGC